MLDPPRGKRKTGTAPKKKRKTWHKYSSTTQENESSASEAMTVPVKVRIKKPYRNNDGGLVDPLPQNIHTNLRDRYKTIEALPEHVIGRQHRITYQKPRFGAHRNWGRIRLKLFLKTLHR